MVTTRLFPTYLFALCLVVWGSWANQVKAEEKLANGVFAVVDGIVITSNEYLSVVSKKSRQEFYHRKPPEAEVMAFRRKIGESMVRQVLLTREAERRGMQPDEEKVAKQLAQLEKQFSHRPKWAQNKDRILGEVGRRYREEGLIEALEAQIHKIAPPNEGELRAYYLDNKEKFTTPERINFSVIMIRVSPDSPKEDWEEARTKIKELQEQLKNGAEFKYLAQLHSQDPSADNGGDLGFLHRTMLGSSVLKSTDHLASGEISQQVKLLEGMALFRLNARESARLNSLKRVKKRAEELWLRDARDNAWKAFGDKLREASVVQMNEGYFKVSHR